MTTTTTRRPRGTGSLFRRGAIWWMKYSVNDRAVRESAGTTSRRVAEKRLQQRLGEVGTGAHIGQAAERLRFEDLVEMVTADYALKQNRSTARMERATRALAGRFAGVKALAITYDRLAAYAAERLADELALATIQYELAILRRGFTLAVRARRLPARPAFPTITVQNARQGFFEPAQVEALLVELPEYLRPVLQAAVLTGWRKQELLTLTWDRVDCEAGTIRLEAEHTKNHAARVFPVDALPALEAVLRSQRNLTDMVEAATGKPVALVFHHFGLPIRDHYHAWRAACERAKVPGRLLHDARRTAVRNLERAGVSRSVAMKLTGHKTENVYRRYAIVSEQDLREGVAKLASLGTVRAQ